MVGQKIGGALAARGHKVKIGTRSPAKGSLKEWALKTGENASVGTFAEAARFGETVFLCTKGDATLQALELAGPGNFEGKAVVDVTNPLDFSKGMPPSLIREFANTNSLGEEVQRALPGARVVKSLNTVNCEVMVNPALSGGEPTMFVCGNDAEAKKSVKGILESFGWRDIIDLGDITAARGLEMILPIWLSLWSATKNQNVAFRIVR
jgi:predicted dinucleotide-binding enzyme